MEFDLGPGVLIAIDRGDAKPVFAARSNEALRSVLREIGSHADQGTWISCLGMWAELHELLVALAGPPADDRPPLEMCVLGGRQLQREDGLVVSMVRPDVVPLLAEAVAAIDRTKARATMESREAGDAQALDGLFGDLVTFYAVAASQGSAVVFAASANLDAT